MNSIIQIRQMKYEDVDMVFQSLDDANIGKPQEYIKRCWEENKSGERITLIALYGDRFAGWLHLLSKSNYSFFVEQGISFLNK